MDPARSQVPNEKIASLKRAIALITSETEWPAESSSAAKGLLNTVESVPNIPNRMTGTPQEAGRRVDQYIQVLEDLHTRLKEASSKSGMQKWKFLQQIKSLASNRPSKCTLLLKTCQDDLSKATHSLQAHFIQEPGKGNGLDASTTASETRMLPNPYTPYSNLQTKPAEPGAVLGHSPSGRSSKGDSVSDGPQDRETTSSIRGEALSVAKTIFSGVDIASGSIPVVGSYVGAVAKVGLAFVDTVQTMDKNDDLANELGSQTAKLSKLLSSFTKKPTTYQGEEMAEHINDLHKELRNVHDKVNQWKSLGRFNKAFRSGDHEEALQGYQTTIQIALEEMQLLASLDTRNVIIELKDSEVQRKQRRLLKCLGDGKYGAQGNAIEDSICSPGTRVEILRQIHDWIRNSSTDERVLWVRGMAGRGKSTIASTVFRGWKCRASCAIFHFRRGQNAINARVICALARQLATSLVPEVRNAVLESVQENEDIADERLAEQFKALFVAPFAKLNAHSHPILIIVDALDEWDNPRDAVDLLRLIDRHSPSFPSTVKFLFTCRPEALLIRTLGPKQWHSLDLDTAPDVAGDLERFIRQACKEIRDCDPDIPKDWPSASDVGRLVEMAQGLFQWARTAITYVNNGSPVDRLRSLLKRPSMWSGLDELYHQILSNAFRSLKLDTVREDILYRVLGTIVVAPYPVSLEAIATLYGKHEVFDEINREEIISFLRKDVLADLNSLLLIPASPTESVRVMHTSIHDLLVSELRCKHQSYFIDPPRCHQQLAKLCFEIMSENLKENICHSSDLTRPSSEMQDTVELEVSMAVRYCCRAWFTHLTEGVRWQKQEETPNITVLAHFESFSKGKLMCWLEVMSLVGATTEAITAARHVHEWLLQRPREVNKPDPLPALWHDVQRFITTFFEPISFGPLHIYISALPHCPTETELWSLYGNHAKIRILQGDQMLTWPSNLWIQSSSAPVKTVAFSPNGGVLAFGSDDGTIRFLDAQTGAVVGGPLTGHSRMVWSVCFSPDGKLLASGSYDSTIRFWDAETRAAAGEPLTIQNGWVTSVCFSPNGQLLASGSDDGTVQFWSTETGAGKGEPLTGHCQRIWSVSFSPNGQLLASGSQDNTVRLWDPHAGVAVGEPLAGHSDQVMSVCFSPDSKLLASGSDDKTIRFWDTQTKTLAREPLITQGAGINSLRFLPDGKVLASGSDDGIIQLWNTQTGAALGGPLTGHGSRVWSICLSSDGKRLASGSDDMTVRLWTPQATATGTKPLVPHLAMVHSVSFSPDGKRLASAHSDSTIRLWDPRTGASMGEPLRGHGDEVVSVCFSPDGRLLASGSGDKTIRFWDSQKGVALGEPLTGHDNWIRSICFSPDGKCLAAGSAGGTIRLWDPRTRLAVGEPLTSQGGWVRAVSFSPDGNLLASGSDDRAIRLWDPHSGVAVGAPLTGHSDYIISVSFSSDGSLLIARCNDGGLAAWDITTRQRCDTARYVNHGFHDHWITFNSSRLLWLPPQYWDAPKEGTVLFGGRLVSFQNGSLSIFDISKVLSFWRSSCPN